MGKSLTTRHAYRAGVKVDLSDLHTKQHYCFISDVLCNLRVQIANTQNEGEI